MWGALGVGLGLGALGLNYLGMKDATKAQNRALAMQQAELQRRNLMQKLFAESELKRLDADKGLQEEALNQIHKLVQDQQGEIAPLRQGFYNTVNPYIEEQKLYLQDPAKWQRQQDKLLMSSPYGAEGAKGEGRAYMAAKANPYTPSSFFTDAAKKAWHDAIRGFSDDRIRRQKQALEAADADYKNKVSDVEGKYSIPINKIKDLLGIGLDHSAKVGNVGAQSVGYGMDSSREAADIGSRMALGKGEASRAQNTFFADILKGLIPEQNVNGYTNAGDYLTDKYFGKELGLNNEEMATVQAIRKLKKDKNINLLDFLNNWGVNTGQQNA